MRICFLNAPIEYYSPISGGALATITMQSARHLIERGHDVTVLTIVNQDEVYPIGKVVPIVAPRRDEIPALSRKFAVLRSKFLGWDWPYYAYYLQSFMRALKQLSPAPDVVICFNDLVAPAYIRQVVPNARIYVWLQNEQGTRQKDISRTVEATSAFLTCSQYIADWTARKYSLPAAKFRVVHSGVDLDAFYPRADYLEQKQPFHALFIGRIDPNKGPDIAADAILRLQQEGFAIRYSVVGGLWFYGHGKEMEDPFFQALKRKMDAVHADYLGHVTRHDVPRVVRDHDVAFVLSRANEPFGLVALETMASGCAVIASDRGGLPEACGGAALLVDPDDFEGVVRHLRTLLSDKTALREQKQRAVERASKSSWECVAGVLEQAIKS
jgi:glycosyltransferase involved in cell wall biosynthesis